MNFITFNIMMMMIKMSLEQVNIIGLEVSVLILTFLTYLVALDDYIELWTSNLTTVVGILIAVVFLFEGSTKAPTEQPKININITL
jgi:hypothetical protein